MREFPQGSVLKERLKRYVKYFAPTEQTDANIRALYLWNLELSKALYPLLALLEVTLRNRLDQIISHTLDDEEWLSPASSLWKAYPNNKELKTLVKEQKYLKDKQQFSRGHWVAGLKFGFWVSL